MKKVVILLCLVLFLLALALPTLYFYEGWYWAKPVSRPHPGEISLPTATTEKLTSNPEKRVGTIVIDRAHENQFALNELSLFIQRVLARGYRIEYLESKAREREEELRARLEEKLRLADAFAIMVPRVSFTAKEVELIKGFLDKGAKLLLIADPTRRSQINSLANAFGMTFEDDYLYNLKESEGNFRNIFVRQFGESDLTKGLKRIALYSVSSITPSQWGLAFTDENTFSNLIAATGSFSPLLLSPDRVLAVSDFTFMVEPYNAAYDNERLLANIVDWLTVSDRKFLLTDFPHFFRDRIRIESADAKVIDYVVRLKNLLEGRGKACELGEFKGGGGEGVFLGLLSHAGKVKGELEAGGISVSTNVTISVKIEGIGPVYKPDMSLLYLYPRGTEKSLILLADKEEGLRQLIDALETGEFRQWLVRDHLALHYPKARPVEKEIPKKP